MLDALVLGGHEIASCAITITEVYAGIRPGEEATTERLLRSLRFYPVTWEIAKEAGDLQNAWRRKGRVVRYLCVPHGGGLARAGRQWITKLPPLHQLQAAAFPEQP